MKGALSRMTSLMLCGFDIPLQVVCNMVVFVLHGNSRLQGVTITATLYRRVRSDTEQPLHILKVAVLRSCLKCRLVLPTPSIGVGAMIYQQLQYLEPILRPLSACRM